MVIIYKIGVNKLFYLFKNLKFLFIIFFFIISTLIFNFSSSGCFLYPLKFTCLFTELNWTLSNQVMEDMSIHYEAWAKGGKGPNFEIENLESYISGVNWVKNWFKIYFISKFSDFILLNISLFILLYFIFFGKFQKKNNSISKTNFFLFYSILVLVFVFWFFNFPTLRYAGYSISFQIISFPICYILSRKIDLYKKNNFSTLYTLIMISLIVFNIRNIHRINNELNIAKNMNHNFSNFPFYWVDKVSFNKLNFKLNYVLEGKSCWNIPSICVRGKDIQFNKIKGYIFLYKK